MSKKVLDIFELFIIITGFAIGIVYCYAHDLDVCAVKCTAPIVAALIMDLIHENIQIWLCQIKIDSLKREIEKEKKELEGL